MTTATTSSPFDHDCKDREKNAFLVEVQQAGIFFASGIEAEPLKQILATVAPNILFPYAREAIDNIVVKGGFPALMLAPVSFDALYAWFNGATSSAGR